MTLPAGIHADVPAAVYHDDPSDTPSLSASIAHTLIARSPAHARACHPKLNPDLQREESDRFDIGTVAHQLLLEGEDRIGIVHFPDYRKKEAQETRDAHRAAGRTPLLTDQADRVRAMVAAAQSACLSHTAQPPLLTAGKPEQTLVWEDDHGVVCRARLDWLRDDYAAIDDVKTTSRSAKPASWGKSTLFSIGAAIQARFYQRGVRMLTGIEPQFRFIVIECEPPYALSVVALAPSAEALADAQIDYALAVWAECLAKDDWPTYTPEVHYVAAPAWLEMEWLEEEVNAA